MKIQKSYIRDFLCVVLGIAAVPYVRAIGNIYALDLIAALGFIYLLTRGDIARIKGLPKLFLGVLVLWLVGAMIGDLINRSAIENCLRGWSKIIAFGFAFTTLWSIIGQDAKRLCLFLIGLSAAAILQAAFWPSPFQIDDPWKFGYAVPVCTIVIILFSGIFNSRKPNPVLLFLVILALSIVSAFFNFRSLFAILIATSAIVAINAWAAQSFGRRRMMTNAVSAASLGVFGLGVFAFTSIYGILASRGALGEAAKIKYLEQTQAGMGLIIGGRTESLVSTRAIADSPIFGHGSWASDPEYAELYLLLLRERGAKIYYSTGADNLIPSHSYLLGSWVENGIFGGLFWIFCLLLAIIALLRLVDFRSRYVAPFAFLITQLAWNIPFSPFGAEARFATAGQLVAAMIVIIAWYGFKKVGSDFSEVPRRPVST